MTSARLLVGSWPPGQFPQTICRPSDTDAPSQTPTASAPRSPAAPLPRKPSCAAPPTAGRPPGPLGGRRRHLAAPRLWAATKTKTRPTGTTGSAGSTPQEGVRRAGRLRGGTQPWGVTDHDRRCSQQPGVVTYEPSFALDTRWSLLLLQGRLGYVNGLSAVTAAVDAAVDQISPPSRRTRPPGTP